MTTPLGHPSVDKRALVAALRAEIARTIEVLERAALEAREAATHEEAKPENDKDTRAIEAAYLAGAQADRVRELERASAMLASLDPKPLSPGARVAAGALVELEHDGRRSVVFFAPVGGGLAVTLGPVEVLVLTPQAPLGRELLGRAAGDSFELKVKGELREYEIVSVT